MRAMVFNVFVAPSSGGHPDTDALPGRDAALDPLDVVGLEARQAVGFGAFALLEFQRAGCPCR